MQYWASDVAGLTETLPPLFDFIKRLSDVGSISAKNLYGCQKGTSSLLSSLPLPTSPYFYPFLFYFSSPFLLLFHRIYQCSTSFIWFSHSLLSPLLSSHLLSHISNVISCVLTVGWVAHGFFDGYLDGGLSGPVHWSLCVTCGAWTALSLWEHVSFTGDESTLHTHLLPAFKGIAEFFLDYMFRIDSVYHTGPTTSPENSYTVQDIHGTYAAQLTLSPAIDASVLRQVANAYSIAIQMARSSDSNLIVPKVTNEEYSRALHAHSVIAAQFRVAISQMPFGANPVVGVNTGLILEYPAPYPSAETDAPVTHPSNIRSQQSVTSKIPTSVSITVSEKGDPGHRHFSSMHWLYPGTFLPSDGKLSGLRYISCLAMPCCACVIL